MKLFVRWQHGTCVECPPQKIPGEDEPYIFSFMNDINEHPDVGEVISSILANIRGTLTSVRDFVQRWRRYRVIWRGDKAQIVEKFYAKDPEVAYFDQNIQYYRRIIEELNGAVVKKDIDCVCLLLSPLSNSIKNHAEMWIKAYGETLHQSAIEKLNSTYDLLVVGIII